MHEDNPWAKEAEDNASRGRRSDIVNMKWTVGEHTIRVCPPVKKGRLPFVKYIVHWIPVTNSVKDRPVIHEVGGKCPICKFVSQLYAEMHRLKEEEDKTDDDPQVKKIQKQISKLRGKKTYDMNIIHRKDCQNEDKTIKIKRLVAGPTVWKPILELGNSDKWGNPSSGGDRGYDLTITVDGEKLKREYTILPDPDRKALTKDEAEAVKKAYDLVKLRKFSSKEDVLDILENARAPLNGLDLEKVGDEMDKNTKKDDSPAPEKDEKDDKEDIPASAVVVDDDKDEVQVKENEKEEKAFAEDEAAESEETSETVEPLMGGFSFTEKEIPLDCRGTYDQHDAGCQECDYKGNCEKLQGEFEKAAKEYNVDLGDMMGPQIEKALATAIAEKKPSLGKSGKSGKSGKKKRDIPF